MSEPQHQHRDSSSAGGTVAGDPGFVDRARLTASAATEKARDVGDRHVSVAVPFRAFERNRSIAASVLAGGLAYRLFLWLLPFGLIVGGALGLGNADGTEAAVASGGLPQAVVDAIGDIARAAEANSWWLLLTGVPLLLWEGYTGARALQLMHSLVWNEQPPRTKPLVSSLIFSAAMCVFVAAVAATWWFRDMTTLGWVLILILMIVPLAAVWLWLSLQLPHGTASWKALLPGAFLVAVGFQITHGLVVYLLGPKLEHATSLYGGLGVVATMLFFMYVVGRLVVTAPILNCALHEELEGRNSPMSLGGSRVNGSEGSTLAPRGTRL